jgi:hypothetical protein
LKAAGEAERGHAHSVRIAFQPPILSVHLDGGEVLTSVVELATVVDAQGAAYVGFTASTRSGFENHDILDWSFTRPEVSSTLELVSSEISFLKTARLPDRNLCTPDQAVIEATGQGAYHIVLPANLEWGASIPNLSSRPVTIQSAEIVGIVRDEAGRSVNGVTALFRYAHFATTIGLPCDHAVV